MNWKNVELPINGEKVEGIKTINYKTMKKPKSIHLASTNCRMHTRQGIKYYCYCGVHMFVDSDRWTDDISKVTCKRCKRNAIT